MSMIIGFVNQKGGAGKTTLSLSIAYESALRGKKTLLVDADPQQSIMGWAEDRERVLPEGFGMISMPTKTIHRDIHSIVPGWDLVVIDGPPRSTDITRSIMLACDLVIVPCTPSGLDVKASQNTLDAINGSFMYHPSLKPVFVINRKAVNTAIGKSTREALQSLSGNIPVLKSEVSMRIIFAEALSLGMSVQEMDPDGKAKNEIKNLYDEIIGVLNEKV